ncbi:hypothetical protein B0T22DRAFT_169849 [Podospora appendiculata]|uniref:Uncharacterized protein n=1 Tax=Podospora appendiculata TaxID=314037 RepID=A0AAE0XBR5_9PEZI|nr:hypothetical protein B0T22DRAFT_169849 [Podospora appendiculata]
MSIPMLPLATILRASFVYFLRVYGAGFLCGCIRVPFIEPVVGVRWAQLMEMPIMFLAIYRAAGTIVSSYLRRGPDFEKRTTGDDKRVQRETTSTISAYVIGVLAVVQLLAAEAGVYVWINWSEGKTGRDWVREMDWAVRVVFFSVLGAFAALPGWLVSGD